MSSSSSNGGGVPNVFFNAPKENYTTATLSSAILSSMVLSIISTVAFIILRNQFLREKKAMKELQQKLFELGAILKELRRQQLEGVKKGIKDQDSILKKRQEDLEKAKNAVTNGYPSDKLIWEPIPYFTMMGEVISGEMSLAEAKKACNDNKLGDGYAVQVCHNRKTGKAVVKGVSIPTETFFGTTDIDALDTQTFTDVKVKCGEGYHPDIDTYIHPRFFILNEIVVAGQPQGKEGWAPVSADVIRLCAKADRANKDQLNETCVLGNSGTCIWNTVGKELLFGWIGALLLPTMFLTGPLGFAVFVAEIGVLTTELVLDLKVKPDRLKKLSEQVENYMERFKDNTLFHNRDLGDPNYMKLYNDLTESWKPYANITLGRFTKCKKDGKGNWLPKEKQYFWKFWKGIQRLRKFEKLPKDTWNCDEISEIIIAGDLTYERIGSKFKSGYQWEEGLCEPL
jgi:hypothetical protein